MFARKGEVWDWTNQTKEASLSENSFCGCFITHIYGVDLEGSSRFGPKSERTLFGPDQ